MPDNEGLCSVIPESDLLAVTGGQPHEWPAPIFDPRVPLGMVHYNISENTLRMQVETYKHLARDDRYTQGRMQKRPDWVEPGDPEHEGRAASK